VRRQSISTAVSPRSRFTSVWSRDIARERQLTSVIQYSNRHYYCSVGGWWIEWTWLEMCRISISKCLHIMSIFRIFYIQIAALCAMCIVQRYSKFVSWCSGLVVSRNREVAGSSHTRSTASNLDEVANLNVNVNVDLYSASSRKAPLMRSIYCVLRPTQPPTLSETEN